MEMLAKGQLSYLILSCLSQRDMYGLELINEINNNSGFEIKMPSLYSNINRMKTLKFISTYLKDSVKGPKCSYSSITDKGRHELERLEKIFGKLQEKSNIYINSKEFHTEKSDNITQKNDDYNDFFAEIDNNSTETVPQKPLSAEKNTVEIKRNENQSNQDIKQNNAVFLNSKIEDESKSPAIKTINTPDVSMDYFKFKKKKSFSENQIGIELESVPALVDDSKEREQAILSLKETLLQSKKGNYDLSSLDRLVKKAKEEKVEATKEEHVDDGRLITERFEEIPTFKRSEPIRLNSFFSGENENKLPAPKINALFDQNCSNMMARINNLYSKAENTETFDSSVSVDNFESYSSLKKYYDSKNISFRVYSRFEKEKKHNTNQLIFFTNLICFGVLSLLSSGLFFLLDYFNLLNTNTNFLYYTLPLIFLSSVAFSFYVYKKIPGKVPKPMLNPYAVAGVSVGCVGLVLLLNYAFGMTSMNLLQYSTTIFLPVIFILIIFTLRHFILLFSLKKFWK